MELAAAERVVELRRHQALRVFLRLAVERFGGQCATGCSINEDLTAGLSGFRVTVTLRN